MNNYYAPDGYRYGVMHHDGSVSNRWNGRTQRQRVEETAARWAAEYVPDNFRPVRRRHGDAGWIEYKSITCPVCGRTSWNPNDVREGYCGNCHDWTTPR